MGRCRGFGGRLGQLEYVATMTATDIFVTCVLFGLMAALGWLGTR